MAAKEKKKGGLRRCIGWILVVWGVFLGIPAALCTVVTLFGGMEVESFGEGVFLFFCFFVLTSICVYMIVGGRRLIKGIAAKVKRKQPQPEPEQPPLPQDASMQEQLSQIDGDMKEALKVIQPNPTTPEALESEKQYAQRWQEREERLKQYVRERANVTMQDAMNTFTPEEQKRFETQVYQYSQDTGRDGRAPEECAGNRGLVFVDGRPVAKEVAERLEIMRRHAKEVQKLPVSVEGTEVRFHSGSFFGWREEHPSPQYETRGVMALTEKEPVITVFEDGVKTRSYRLQTEGDEDFTGKYFHYSVRVQLLGKYRVPAMQLDGFIADTDEDRKMTMQDVGYRMEGHILACGGGPAKAVREMNRGQDLPNKGLKYPGYTTPSNVRLVGVCAKCGESFTFHGYAFYMGQNDVAYSDDGLDCCSIAEYNIDKDTWSYEEDGKTFRYYNSFSCPHCGAPYIDYKKNPGMKQFGVSGCVHLGRKAYHAGVETSA